MKRYDVIVAGGGMAGVGAAIGAAREGKKVLLIDRNNALGGMASVGLVNPFMRYWTTDEEGEKVFLTRGLFEEIVNRLGENTREMKHMYFSEEHLKFLLNRMMQEAGAEMLLRTVVIGAECEGDRIRRIEVFHRGGREFLEADVFVDCTGDGQLARLAGCEIRMGREEDGLCQPMTLCFRMIGVDIDLFREEKPELNRLYQKAQEEGKIRNPRENILSFVMLQTGVLHLNSTRVCKLNPVDGWDVTRAELEAREQVFELLAFLKENSRACRNAELIMTAAETGVRESCQVVGEHLLTQEDLLACRVFEDSIALGNYDIDIHSPDGSGTSHHYFAPGEYYTIPYRTLTPKDKANLLVAGRCISATHEAQASIRIMPICCALGEAAGTAAALACDTTGGAVKTVEIQKLRRRLADKGAAL